MSEPAAANGAPEGAVQWHEAVALEDLPTDGGGVSLQVGATRVALFRQGDAVYAIADACPHMGASLGMGVALEGDVTCPWHGWHFRLRDGQNTDGLEACVATYAVRTTPEGRVEVGVPRGEESGTPS